MAPGTARAREELDWGVLHRGEHKLLKEIKGGDIKPTRMISGRHLLCIPRRPPWEGNLGGGEAVTAYNGKQTPVGGWTPLLCPRQ